MLAWVVVRGSESDLVLVAGQLINIVWVGVKIKVCLENSFTKINIIIFVFQQP